MNQTTAPALTQSTNRLLSLDFFRGIIMVILVFGETGFFTHLFNAFRNPVTQFLSIQFEHSEWRGLHIWDLLLPAFMLIAGTSISLSYEKQRQLNFTYTQSLWKTVKRSCWLLFLGVLIYSVRNGKLNLQFSNVLTELSFATLISFLIINLKPVWQLTVSLLLLIITGAVYRFSHVPGFDHPFVDGQNFGNYVDVLIIGRVNTGYGTTMNIPTASVVTIWGSIAGQLLQSAKPAIIKCRTIAIAGIAAIMIGFCLDLSDVDPMLKWISSPSFVFATGGIALLALAVAYYRIDIRRHRKYLFFFTVVGMNSIFIYLFFIFFGSHWMNGFVTTLVSGLLAFIGINSETGAVCSCLVIFGLEWGLCYFLYRKKMFFRL